MPVACARLTVLPRIYLSPPDVTGYDRALLNEAIDSNWVAPAGPDIGRFECEVASVIGRAHAVALSSGTAALHLLLLESGVGPGDRVLVSSFTFAATANAVMYAGAEPVFIDSEATTWTISPDLVEEELVASRSAGRMPKAAIVVDLYGQCADYARLLPLFAEHGVAVISDAAESLGATYGGQPAGSFGHAAALSFNGNKIITTSGGGMLVTDDEGLAERARHLSTQAREDAPHYEHVEVGYNYRMSNLLAAFGRGQLADLDRRVDRKRELNGRYRDALEDLPGVTFMPKAPYGEPTWWLTCLTIDADKAGFDREALRLRLEQADIESRPTWKPMHMQPVFAAAERRVDGTSERLFANGLCLPSGSGLSDAEQGRVIALAQELAV